MLDRYTHIILNGIVKDVMLLLTSSGGVLWLLLISSTQ